MATGRFGRILGSVVAASALLTAGLVAAPAAPAATSPAHSLAAARTHAATAVNAWVTDSLTSVNQENWYRVVLPQAGFLSVVLGDLPKDYSLAVYNEAGTRLGVSANAGTRYEGFDVPRASGTYFVQVRTGSATSTTEYALSARLVVASFGVLTARVGTVGDVVGEFVNNTDQWAAVPLADVSFFSTGGTLLRKVTNVFTIGWFLIPPHNRMPYSVFPGNGVIPPPKTLGRISVVPHPTFFGTRSPAPLTVRESSRVYDAVHDSIVVNGTMTNTSTRTAKLVVVQLRGYDRRGVVVGLEGSEPRTLGPGASTPFRAFYDNFRSLTPTALVISKAVESTDTA